MKLFTFHEYLNSKGNVDKPVVKLDGDRTDPMTPPNAPKSGKPYAGKGHKADSKKGFGDQGDKSLKYDPKVDNDSKGKAPAKLPTVESIEVTALAAKAIAHNPLLIETLVRDLKGKGLLGALVAEMFNHRETFGHMSAVMSHESHGPIVCGKLARAIKEEVAAPFHDQIDDDEEEDMEDNPFSDEAPDDVDTLGEDPEMGDGPMEDPAMGGDTNTDPALAGSDPNMEGMPVDPMMDLDNHPAMKHPAMRNFCRAMMRSYQRAMMGKK